MLVGVDGHVLNLREKGVDTASRTLLNLILCVSFIIKCNYKYRASLNSVSCSSELLKLGRMGGS